MLVIAALAKKSKSIVTNLEATQNPNPHSSEALQRSREKAEAEEERRLAREEKAIRHKRALERSLKKAAASSGGQGHQKHHQKHHRRTPPSSETSSSTSNSDVSDLSDGYEGGEDNNTLSAPWNGAASNSDTR